jgi:hypothetical protein
MQYKNPPLCRIPISIATKGERDALRCGCGQTNFNLKKKIGRPWLE